MNNLSIASSTVRQTNLRWFPYLDWSMLIIALSFTRSTTKIVPVFLTEREGSMWTKSKEHVLITILPLWKKTLLPFWSRESKVLVTNLNKAFIVNCSYQRVVDLRGVMLCRSPTQGGLEKNARWPPERLARAWRRSSVLWCCSTRFYVGPSR